jgi:hypothetical protein
MKSSLYIDETCQKKYHPTRNDENLNNPNILQMWQESVDCQPILSSYAVLKYTTKYAFEEEGRLEIYHHMLTRIVATSHPYDPVSNAYRNLHSKAIVD